MIVDWLTLLRLLLLFAARNDDDLLQETSLFVEWIGWVAQHGRAVLIQRCQKRTQYIARVDDEARIRTIQRHANLTHPVQSARQRRHRARMSIRKRHGQLLQQREKNRGG